ncbi:unnamed protein product, partial [Adineta steineri]
EHLFEFHSSDPYQSKTNRSYSLFQLIPENRTCSQADIEQHWCACLNWNNISINEAFIQKFANQAIDFLNNFVSDYKDQCAKLQLYRINKASQLEANERLLKFVDSSDNDGRVPRFNNNTLINNTKKFISNQTEYYQIQFES